MLAMIGQSTYKTMTRGQNKYPMAGHMAKDCPFPSTSGNWRGQQTQNRAGDVGNQGRKVPGRVFSEGLGGSQQKDEDSEDEDSEDEDSEDEFIDVKLSKSSRKQKELPNTPSLSNSRLNTYDVLANCEEGSNEPEVDLIQIDTETQEVEDSQEKLQKM
ncbi:hypothetical protein R1sor_012462 [Riccia sorocarpa]|uniref:Uncharacterized protein n=1 Tax=Riccia sorocarpa TaxID=122646 RepID=A0ABD3I517_9MARC